MANGRLNEIEAKKSWVLRECGWKVRAIGERFDVDPRRLYEVWEGQEYRYTRYSAQKLFRRMFPNERLTDRFMLHLPSFKRLPRNDGQKSLPF